MSVTICLCSVLISIEFWFLVHSSSLRSKARMEKDKDDAETVAAVSTCHGEQMMKRCYSFQQEDKFCDVTIKIGGRSFRAHKMILAAASKYFESMFSGGFAESTKSEVEIVEDGHTFQKLLEYAYSGKLDVNEDNIVTVLRLACYMQFDVVIEKCTSQLWDNYLPDWKISCEDAFILATLVQSHGEPLNKLAGYCISSVAIDFPKFVKTDVFLEEMGAGLFEDVLSEYELACFTAEEEILTHMISWLTHDLRNRKKHAAKLLNKIRLGLIPATELRKACVFFNRHGIVECCHILERIMGLQAEQETSSSCDESTEMFAPRNIISAPISVGGSEDDTTVYFVKKVPCWSDTKWKFGTIPTGTGKIMSHSAVVVDGVLYVAGGSQGYQGDDNEDLDFENEDPLDLVLDKVWEYIPDSNSWKQLTSMTCERTDFAMVNLDGFIYAIGGKGVFDLTHQSAERYDISRDEWSMIAKPIGYYRDPHAVALNGKILVCGFVDEDYGANPNTCTLEMYNPVTNVWQKLLSETYETPVFDKPILTVHHGECYRVVAKLDNGSNPFIDDLLFGGKIYVNKIIIKERGRNHRVTAALGIEEKQVDLKCRRAFCLNGKAYVYLSDDFVFNTGFNVDDLGPEGLGDKWEVSFHSFESIAIYTFDILKLKPTQ